MYLMTQESLTTLIQKLKELREELDKVQLEMGSAASSNADLRENFAFNERQERIFYLQMEIMRTKEKIGNAKLIGFKRSKKIGLLSSVKIVHKDGKPEESYLIGSEIDAVLFPTKYLNHHSPIAKKMIKENLAVLEI